MRQFPPPALHRKSLLMLSLSCMALAGCSGSEDDGLITIFGQPGGIGVFGSYFMPSITSDWREAAASFRNNSPRFQLQDGTFTINGNVVFANPLHSSRVDYAHAVGLSGEGQVIAVVDDGFLQSHAAFAGKSTTETGNPIVEFHGTMVASVAAGNSSTMVGVAPGADLIFSDWGQFDFSNLIDAAVEARRRRAVAQNNSWGFTSSFANQAGYDAIFGDQTGQDWLAALRSYALPSGSYEGGVVVFAISNDRFATQSGIMEALPLLEPTLESAWIAVGNSIPVFNDNGVSAVASRESSACLEAARWCLMADGSWIGASDNGGYVSASGSSFAAPQVSGALALLAEAFPSLTPHQLRARLLASADNTFTGFVSAGQVDLDEGFGTFLHTYSTEFGHGFLDIRAALLPIGQATLALGNGETVKTQDYSFATGGAMGDAVQRSLDGIDLTVNDQLGGDFEVAAKSFVSTSAPTDMAETLAARSFAKDFRSSRTAPLNPLADTFAAHPGQSMDLAGPEGSRATVLMGGARDYGIALSQRLAEDGLAVDLGLKLARDGGSLMGFSGTGSEGGASMASLTLALSTDTGEAGGFFALSGEMGVADLGATAAISTTGRAQFNSLRLDIGGRSVLAQDDRLTFGVSMPIAVTSGQADMQVPVSLADGATEVRAVGIDLAPQERQVDLSISYAVPMSDRSEFLMEVVRAENYGNIAGASDSAAVFGMKWSF
jgi:subtilase-type serine protease